MYITKKREAHTRQRRPFELIIPKTRAKTGEVGKKLNVLY